MKLVSVVGVPKPLEAIFSIADIERDEDKDYSFSRYPSASFASRDGLLIVVIQGEVAVGRGECKARSGLAGPNLQAQRCTLIGQVTRTSFDA